MIPRLLKKHKDKKILGTSSAKQTNRRCANRCVLVLRTAHYVLRFFAVIATFPSAIFHFKGPTPTCWKYRLYRPLSADRKVVDQLCRDSSY